MKCTPSINQSVFMLQPEVRCHAVLCKTEQIAQTIASQLHERLAVALDEFVREKRRSQNSRIHHRSASIPNDGTSPGGGSVRTKFLKQGANFRPPIGNSNSAPKLGSITEGDEDDNLDDELPADDVDSRMSTSWSTDIDHECDADVDEDVVFSSSCSQSRCVAIIPLLQNISNRSSFICI